MERNRTQLRGAALLMLTALIWGTAFVAQSVGMDHLGPCAFTAVRNYIGCVALLPVIAFASRLRKGKPEDDGEQVPPAKARKRLALWGAACGLLLGSATLLQQAGMQTASPGKAGFLTALYIVIVPVLGVFLGRRPGLKVWAGVVLALVGAYLLSVKGGEGIATGDLLVIASAVVFSLHILVVDFVPAGVDGVKLSCVQFLVAGLLATVLAQPGIGVRGAGGLGAAGAAPVPPGAGGLRLGVRCGGAGPAAPKEAESTIRMTLPAGLFPAPGVRWG